MAQNPGSQQNQDIDLDELEVVILILAKNANTLGQAGNFLTRRGWPTTVMTNISKALEFVADKKPDFVLVSFNHPNPAVFKLPELIIQTFNLSCIGFIENMDAPSQQRLNNFKMRYKIQGIPSGPNLQRSIRKILAEKFNIKTDGDRAEAARAERNSGNENVTVRGSGPSKDGPTVISHKGPMAKGTHVIRGEASGTGSDSESGSTTGSGPSGRQRLSQLQPGEMGEDDGGTASAGSSGRKRLSDVQGAETDTDDSAAGPSSSGRKRLSDVQGGGHGDAGDSDVEGSADDSESVATGKYKMTRKARKSLKDLTSGDAPGGPSGNMFQGKTMGSGVQSTESSAELAAKLKASLFGEGGQDTSDETGATDGPSGGGVAAAEAAAREAAGGVTPSQGSGEQEGADGRLSATDAFYANARGKAAASADSSDADATTRAVAEEAGHGAKAKTGTELPAALVEMTPEAIAALPPLKILERAVAAALHRICQSTSETITRELGPITKIAVFPIDSSSTPGFLVCGVEQDPTKIEDFFLRTCESALREEFAHLKVPAVLENGFWVHVPEVLFNVWVTDRANFKVVLPHEESEVGIGFFPISKPMPKAQASHENKDMMSIKIDDISTDQPVNFKAYLHLKQNKKFFLYLRNGRRLQPEQKERLKDNKVQDIFMKRVDAENLKMFLAASYLRDLIKKAG
jgi:hypothetical protein